MPIETNVSNRPYYDDYTSADQYYRYLFKPSVSVQVRELNGLQSAIQNQIESFGDNIFKVGTIVSGCNFEFFPSYPYAKLTDVSTTGVPFDPSEFEGYYAKNNSELSAYIVNSITGYESTDPNLKTIYIKYNNSGNSGSSKVFSAGETLTIFDPVGRVFKITATNGGTGFSNTDTLVILPSIQVNVTSGTLSNGDYITDPLYNSNVEIIGVHTINNSNDVVLDLKPLTTSLTNATVNSYAWTIGLYDDITDSATGTVAATVVKVFGDGSAEGQIITNGVGKITTITMTDYGKGYTYTPYATVKSSNNAVGLAALELTPQTYLNKVTIASVANAVGNGYAFGVDSGKIYQNGYFLDVEKQIVIVNSYSSSPNNVTVGFQTVEEIVDYTVDSSLLDNCLETENATAPGADRLKMVPTLVVANTEDVEGNTEFCSLVSWNDGNPYRQNQFTQYARIGDEIAERTNDISGNYVLDPFLVTTKSIDDSNSEGSYYTVVVDPGTAYVAGHKVQTLRNYKIDVEKTTNTLFIDNRNIAVDYDDYIRVKELGGLFQYSTGDVIYFYTTAKGFLSNSSLSTAGNTTPQGTQIGNARIRSLVLETGTPGDANATYRMYLFNINMSTGKTFRSIKSAYYNGTYKGICDVVQEYDASTNSSIAMLHTSNNSSLVFNTEIESIKNSNNTTYIYRTIDQTTTTSNSGLLVKSIAATPNEFYPYSGTLSSGQMKELYVVPMGNNLIAYTAYTGTVSVNTTSANVVGSSTTFLTDLSEGDYINVGNSTANAIVQINRVVNNTLAVLTSNCSFANASASYNRAFPKYVPIPFGDRSGLTANVDSNTNVLTLNFGMSFEGTTTVNTAIGVNIKRTGVTSTAKTANRTKYVKLRLANNVAGTTGPWCLGVPDAIRLRNVYTSTASTVNTASTDVTRSFYINHNQNKDYLGLSSLSIYPNDNLELTSSDYLLVSFDYVSRNDDGYFDTVSYLGTANSEQIAVLDSSPLSSLTTACCSWEVPEFYDNKGKYYDLIKCFDFRPAAAATATPAATSGSAPINPSATLSFGNTADPANDKKFPLPGSVVISDIEEYLGRKDVVIVGNDESIVVKKGTPAADPSKRKAPEINESNNMILNEIDVPAYPVIAENVSNTINTVVNRRLSWQTGRISNHKINTLTTNQRLTPQTQVHGYSMAQIAQLERRIQDLEYMTSLASLESDITKRVVPSSIDNSLNRFKFGFIADDFADFKYSDIDDPQYTATIEPVDKTTFISNTGPKISTNLCVPEKYVWNTRGIFSHSSITYSEALLIKQDYATLANTPIVNPTCNIGNTTVITTSTANSVFLDTLEGTMENNQGSGKVIVDSNTLKFSTLAANASIYFYFPNDPVIQVYQSNTPTFNFAVGSPQLVTTTANAVSLDANTFNRLLSNTWTRSFFLLGADEHTVGVGFGVNGLVHVGGSGSDSVYGSGVMRFRHDPTKGLYYNIKVSKPDGKHSLRHFTMVEYPTDVHQNIINDPCGHTSTTMYEGVGLNCQYLYQDALVLPEFDYFYYYKRNKARAQKYGVTVNEVYGNVSGILTQYDGMHSEINYYDGVRIHYAGLKPNTIHTLKVNGVNASSSDVKPVGGRFGDSLVTDQSGKISITYHVTDTNWINNLKLAQTYQQFEITDGVDSHAIATLEKAARKDHL